MSGEKYSTIEEIKEGLQSEYNDAVKKFNENKYKDFLRNLRVALEWLAKLTIFEMSYDETAANEILQGKKNAYYHLNVDGPLESSALLLMASRVCGNNRKIIEKHSRFLSNEFFKFLNIYKRSSSDHHANVFDKNTNVIYLCAASIPFFIDYVRNHSLFSPGTINFLSGLNKFDLDHTAYFNKIISEERLQHTKAIGEKNKELAEKENQLRDANTEKDNAQKEYNKCLVQKQAAEKELEKLRDLSRKQDSNLAKHGNTIKDLRGQIAEKDKQYEDKKKELEKKISEYKTTIGEKDSIIKEKEIEIEKLKSKKKELEINDALFESSAEKPDDIADESIAFADYMSKKLFEAFRVPWKIDEDRLDDDQLDLVERTNDKNMLVTGCAGSGKSIIAMLKAEQLARSGASVILIAYTKSLSAFMREGVDEKNLPYYFYFYHNWQKTKPAADYIIVDEIQDFELDEIKEFIKAARKHYFFFGDWAQSVYGSFKNNATEAEVKQLTGLTPLVLYTNYRLPKNVAKITQDYVGVNVKEYCEKDYQNDERSMPRFVKFNDLDEQVRAIRDIVDQHAGQSVGILLPKNDDVKYLSQTLKDIGVDNEAKFNDKSEDAYFDSLYELQFKSPLPKIMTYHSAKGLQFDVVILPMYEGSKDRNILYVAMTRTVHHLYVLYSTPNLMPPLSNVPLNLYFQEL